MLAATLIANLITPALFVAVEKLIAFFKRKGPEREPRGEGPTPHPVVGAGGAVTPDDEGAQ